MKNQLLTLILIYSSLSISSRGESAVNVDYRYESTIVINIKNHTSEEVQSAHDLLLKNSAIAIDYYCLASGVITFKLSHNFSQEADVKQLVLKTLSSKLSVKRIAIIFVDIHSKISQC